jgi:hypothetical protein
MRAACEAYGPPCINDRLSRLLSALIPDGTLGGPGTMPSSIARSWLRLMFTVYGSVTLDGKQNDRPEKDR